MVQEWVPNGLISVCGYYNGMPCGNPRECLHYDRLEQSRHYNVYHTPAERARYRSEIQDNPAAQVRAWLATIDPTIFTDWVKKKAKCLRTVKRNAKRKPIAQAQAAANLAAAEAAAAAQTNDSSQQVTRSGRVSRRVNRT